MSYTFRWYIGLDTKDLNAYMYYVWYIESSEINKIGAYYRLG